MRNAEWIHIAVFSFFAALAWIRRLPARRRAKVTLTSAAGVGAAIVAARVLPRLLPPLAASVVRDWLPAPLVLVVYWQAGEFFTRVDHKFQAWLESVDARAAAPLLRFLARPGIGRLIGTCFEAAYLLCYPMIPMSMAMLYALRLGRYADSFWTVTLSATYFCYGVLPFLQTLPPRAIEEPWLPPRPPTPIRRFNLLILRDASIHANTFPSAHVAASSSAALVMAAVAPWPAGLLFAAIALGICFGTFAGRYHYMTDAAAGVLVAAIAFAAGMGLHLF